MIIIIHDHDHDHDQNDDDDDKRERERKFLKFIQLTIAIMMVMMMILNKATIYNFLFFTVDKHMLIHNSSPTKLFKILRDIFIETKIKKFHFSFFFSHLKKKNLEKERFLKKKKIFFCYKK